MDRRTSCRPVMAVLLIAVVGLPGCSTATAPAIGPLPKLVAWAPATGGQLFVDYYSPSSMPPGKIAMGLDPAYNALRPAGVNPTYVAYTLNLPALNSGDNVVLDYLWRSSGSSLYERVGDQDFIYSSSTIDYIAAP